MAREAEQAPEPVEGCSCPPRWSNGTTNDPGCPVHGEPAPQAPESGERAADPMSQERYVKLSEVERAYVAGFMAGSEYADAGGIDDENEAERRAADFLARSGLGVEPVGYAVLFADEELHPTLEDARREVDGWQYEGTPEVFAAFRATSTDSDP